MFVVPMAIAYDLVLEAAMLARQGTKRRQRAFSQELAEMVRHAVGYQTRAFVTFGTAIPLTEYDPESRRDLVSLAHRMHTLAAVRNLPNGMHVEWSGVPQPGPGRGVAMPVFSFAARSMIVASIAPASPPLAGRFECQTSGRSAASGRCATGRPPLRRRR